MIRFVVGLFVRLIGAVITLGFALFVVLALLFTASAMGFVDTGDLLDRGPMGDLAPGDDSDVEVAWDVPFAPGSEPPSEPHPGDPGASSGGQGDDRLDSAAIERAVHDQTNEVRGEHEIGSVDHDDRIANVSRAHSADMNEREYFDHVDPDGETPGDRMSDFFPGHCRAVGENLAMISTTPGDDVDSAADRVVEGWMNSPSHRENLLTEEWDSQGIGVYVTDDGRVYATQKFCDVR